MNSASQACLTITVMSHAGPHPGWCIHTYIYTHTYIYSYIVATHDVYKCVQVKPASSQAPKSGDASSPDIQDWFAKTVSDVADLSCEFSRDTELYFSACIAIYTCIYIYIYIYIYICMHACMHIWYMVICMYSAWLYACIVHGYTALVCNNSVLSSVPDLSRGRSNGSQYIYRTVSVGVYVCVCMYVSVCVYIYIYIYIHTHTHTYIYLHIHTHTYNTYIYIHTHISRPIM